MADLRLPLSHRPALHSASVFLLWAGGAHYDENKERGANMKYCQLAHSSCRSSRRQARGLTLRRGSATKLTSMARTSSAMFHFTPTSASWLNAVEGFFATLTKRRLKRGVFRSVTDLQAAINRFLEEHNQQSQPFTWTADPDKIIAAVRRGHQVLDSIH